MGVKKDKLISMRMTERQKEVIENFKTQLSYELGRNVTFAETFLYLISEYNKEGEELTREEIVTLENGEKKVIRVEETSEKSKEEKREFLNGLINEIGFFRYDLLND